MIFGSLLLNNRKIKTVDPIPEQDLDWSNVSILFTAAQSDSGGNNGHFLWSPRGLWHNGRTYHAYPRPHANQGLGQLYIFVYDENDGLMRPYRFGSVGILQPDLGVADNHVAPVFQIDADGNLFGFQERPHDTPIDIYKGVDFNTFQLLAEKINPGTGVGAESSYHNMIRLPDDNFWSWCRMTALYKAYSGGHGASINSSDGLEGWGSLVRNTTNPRPTLSYSPSGVTDTRHYGLVPYYRQVVGSYIYLMRVQRVDNHASGLGLWHKFYLHRTPLGAGRGTLFENLLGTPYTHDVSGANYMTETILDNNFLFYNSGSHLNNAFNPIYTLSLAPKLYIVTGDANTGDLLFHIVDITARTLVTKDLNISGYHFYDPTIYQIMAVKHLAYIEADEYVPVGYVEAGVEMDYPGSVVKSHLFRSYDEGDTWEDQGDVFSDVATSTYDLTFPFNYHEIPRYRNFVLTCNAPDPVTTYGDKKTYFKRVAKGRISVETPNIVVPAASFSDANNFFDYLPIDGQISRSGNNVTAMTDQFGLRNATATNNPQWNGSNEITLNGTNQDFSIATTGFSGLTKCTFFAVVRRTSATMPGILFFSNAANSLNYLGWFLNDGGAANAPSLRFVEQGGSTLIDYGQYVAAQDENVLLAFATDGRCKTDIYVNGQKQFYQTTGYSTLAQFGKRGLLSFGTITSVKIGRRDISGTDLYFPFAFKRLMMKNTVYDFATFRALEKKIADAHGITLNYGYQ